MTSGLEPAWGLGVGVAVGMVLKLSFPVLLPVYGINPVSGAHESAFNKLLR